MEDMRRILSYVRRAVDDYGMIEDGDSVAVGVSGGKDSLVLLAALAALSKFYPKKFSLIAITADMGWENMDLSGIKDLCSSLGIEYIIEKTEIAKIIFDIRKEENPCSLCSRMRRGVLHSSAVAHGCNKVALGHHFDDAVETFMMNLFFEGRLGSFSPVTYLSRSNIHVIRPLIYAQEKYIGYFARKNGLPIVESPCPEDKNTERENMKKLLASLEKDNKGLRYRIFGAMCKGEIDGYRLFGKMPE